MSSTTSLLRRLILLALAFVLVPILMMLVMTPMVGTWGSSHMWNGPMTGGPISPWLWTLLWLIVLAAVIGIGYFLYGAVGSARSGGSDQAIEELRIAYARGELSDEEFETRLERLRQKD
mgnify:CR=1 FL=1